MHVLRTLAAGLLAAVTMASPALAVTCTVNSSDGLNIRSEATTNSSVVAVMSNGSTMELLDTSNPYWFQISYNGYTGYVSTEYIKVNRESYRVTDGPLNIRSGPGASYELLGTLAQDEVVEVIGESNGWYQIAQGYIHGDYVEKVTAQAASTSSSSSGSDIADYALQFKGYSYTYGGSSPSAGFDCSGLVYYVCSQLGYTVNRTANSQMSNGAAVSKDQLQPGDLVFFNSVSSTGASHVGIYIGDNQFLHASTPTVGVVVSKLSEPFFTKYYVGARRL